MIGYFRRAALPSIPAYGYLGIAALVLAEVLMLRGVEPIATFFTPIAWSAYILIADAAVLALTNRSRLNDAPIVLARMALLSIPLWLIFEAYNLRLQNWMYTGVPPGLDRSVSWIWMVIRDDHAGNVRNVRFGGSDAAAAAGQTLENFCEPLKIY